MLNWRVTVATADGPEVYVGGAALPKTGCLSVVCSLPPGTLQSVTATLDLSMEEDEKVFMNGYQTWSHCPEYGKHDKIRGLHGVPRFIVDKFSFDRYGDYHFVDYPNRKGVIHGFSWCYFRRGERFRLIASLDETPGYTMFRYDSGKGELTVERDCAGVACSGEIHAFDLYFAEGTEDEVFDGWFAAMGLSAPAAKPIKGYSSWYNRYEDISEETVRDDLAGCKTLLAPGDLFQIDDGWEPAVGDWLEPDTGVFRHGLKPLVDEIHEAGFIAGLWLAPFVCCKDSLVTEEHPDWLLQVSGKPWSCGSNWGGFYSLDIDNPEVQDYLRRVFHRVLHEWEFDLVKLDFLYGAAPFGTPRESRAARMIRAMEFLRELCGDKLILGCGVPVMPAFGRVDYCRVSCDVSLDWNDRWFMRAFHRERVSTKQAIDNTIVRRQLNGRAYISDPDVFFLRDDNIRLTAEQKLLLAQVNALLGGVLLTSDDPAVYTDAQRETYKNLLRLRNAENIRVNGDTGVIHYVLDGRKMELKFT